MVFISGGMSGEMNRMDDVIIRKETAVAACTGMVAGAFQIPTVEDKRKRAPPVSVGEGGRHVRREWAGLVRFLFYFIYFKICFFFYFEILFNR